MMIFLTFITGLIFALGSVGQRAVTSNQGFTWKLLSNPFFLFILTFPAIALFIQIYVISRYDASRTITLISVFALSMTALLAALLLKEKLSPLNWAGIVLALVSIALVTNKS